MKNFVTETIEFVWSNYRSKDFNDRLKDFIEKQWISLNNMGGLNIIKDVNFYKINLYCDEIKNNENLLLIMNISSHIKEEILKYFGVPSLSEKYEEYGKLERQISPPLSTYEYKSGNEITYSDKSYGLLFE